MLLDHTELLGFSSSVEAVDDGGGKSPYNPPNMFVLFWCYDGLGIGGDPEYEILQIGFTLLRL